MTRSGIYRSPRKQSATARLPMHCVHDSGLSMVRAPNRAGTRGQPLDDSWLRNVSVRRDRSERRPLFYRAPRPRITPDEWVLIVCAGVALGLVACAIGEFIN